MGVDLDYGEVEGARRFLRLVFVCLSTEFDTLTVEFLVRLAYAENGPNPAVLVQLHVVHEQSAQLRGPRPTLHLFVHAYVK